MKLEENIKKAAQEYTVGTEGGDKRIIDEASKDMENYIKKRGWMWKGIGVALGSSFVGVCSYLFGRVVVENDPSFLKSFGFGSFMGLWGFDLWSDMASGLNYSNAAHKVIELLKKEGIGEERISKYGGKIIEYCKGDPSI